MEILGRQEVWWICFIAGGFQRWKLPVMLHKEISPILSGLYLRLGKRCHHRGRDTTSLLKQRRSSALVNTNCNIWMQCLCWLCLESLKCDVQGLAGLKGFINSII